MHGLYSGTGMNGKDAGMQSKSTVTENAYSVQHARCVAEMFKDDGHTLWTAEGVAEETGVPISVVKRWERVHESDGSYKGSIWSDGTMVDEVRAVYSLDAVESVAFDLGITSDLRGRSFRGRALCQSIIQITETMPPDMMIKGACAND